MSSVSDPARATARIQAQIEGIPRLRGSGPNPFDFDIWNSRTIEVLEAIYGDGSPEIKAYFAAAGERGRLPGVRGQAENMTLNIHGEWGIRRRLERGEAVLRSFVAALGSS
jgi:hypothetical protein